MFLWTKLLSILLNYKQLILTAGILGVTFFGARRIVLELSYNYKATHSKKERSCVDKAKTAKEQNNCFAE